MDACGNLHDTQWPRARSCSGSRRCSLWGLSENRLALLGQAWGVMFSLLALNRNGRRSS